MKIEEMEVCEPKITCPECTFDNYIDMERCEACGYDLYR
jgi:hypothetical protein